MQNIRVPRHVIITLTTITVLLTLVTTTTLFMVSSPPDPAPNPPTPQPPHQRTPTLQDEGAPPFTHRTTQELMRRGDQYVARVWEAMVVLSPIPR